MIRRAGKTQYYTYVDTKLSDNIYIYTKRERTFLHHFFVAAAYLCIIISSTFIIFSAAQR